MHSSQIQTSHIVSSSLSSYPRRAAQYKASQEGPPCFGLPPSDLATQLPKLQVRGRHSSQRNGKSAREKQEKAQLSVSFASICAPHCGKPIIDWMSALRLASAGASFPQGRVSNRSRDSTSRVFYGNKVLARILNVSFPRFLPLMIFFFAFGHPLSLSSPTATTGPSTAHHPSIQQGQRGIKLRRVSFSFSHLLTALALDR